jgi:threonine synthase
MFAKNLACLCGKTFPLNADLFLCPACGRSLEVGYDYASMRKRISKGALGKRPFSHMRYREFYPVRDPVSIGEGGTPLLESRNIGRRIGLDLCFKLESLNPTGSFKDRGSSVEVAKAVDYGAKSVVCASTGNMGASVAAYSAVAGLKCHIFVPKAASHVKMEQILAYGAKVFHVSAGYSSVEGLVERISSRPDFYLLGDYLWRREGTKSVGYEILEQSAPDWIFSPVGNGTLVSATWKAAREFSLLNLAKKRPRIAAIQASGCSPVARAYKTGKPLKPQKHARTIAHAIECEYPIDGERVLAAVKQSGGFASAVTDSEIIRARELLAREEGIFAEPSGAAALAGLIRNRDRIDKDEKVVCIVTGHGLKNPRTAIRGEPVETSIKSLAKAFSVKRPITSRC